MKGLKRRRQFARTCGCGEPLRRYWYYCPKCSRRQIWRDEHEVTGAECYYCRWIVSDSFYYCPWCGRDISDEASSEEPLKKPRGFSFHARCDYGCGGGVQYPMQYCPWCAAEQHWIYGRMFDGVCPHCDGGVGDQMNYCVWCGNDAAGQDLLLPALRRVRGLLREARVPNWGYRILVRPGISGVDPRYPKIVEIQRRLIEKRALIDWPGLVGLISHELGHSFMFQHWPFARSARFRHAFGDVDKAYRGVDESWVSFRKRTLSDTPANHVTGYAATHPLEDFAETFRFYVIRRGRLKELLAEIGRKGKGVAVFEKFLTLHYFLAELRQRARERNSGG
ncbi:MAG: putative zinc-binding metallopeptidase [Gemmatimonadota bacterium]|nr:putative zinc-binding metallopeptidase [Candidatus Palauibacterales bacterium]